MYKHERSLESWAKTNSYKLNFNKAAVKEINYGYFTTQHMDKTYRDYSSIQFSGGLMINRLQSTYADILVFPAPYTMCGSSYKSSEVASIVAQKLLTFQMPWRKRAVMDFLWFILVTLQQLVKDSVIAILILKVYPSCCGVLRFQLSDQLDAIMKVTQERYAYYIFYIVLDDNSNNQIFRMSYVVPHYTSTVW